MFNSFFILLNNIAKREKLPYVTRSIVRPDDWTVCGNLFGNKKYADKIKLAGVLSN